jgi:outer membrane protein OmpA-like peptidoglycan-associated protein
MAQIGKCSNRVGCTLAYTGQEIRFEGSPVCPECGQPLTEVAKPKKSSKLWLLILIPVLFLAVAAVGFYAVEKYFVGSDGAKVTPTATPTATPQVSATQSQSDGKMVDGKSKIPADVLNKANNQSATPEPTVAAATPTASPSPVTQQSPPGPTESPTPSSGGKPPKPEGSPGEGKTPPGPQKSPGSGGGDNAGQTVDTKPKQLSAAEIEATKQDVLKRISALPKMSESEKTKLSDKVETARYMQRVGVVYFEKGSSQLPRPAIEKLVSLFKTPEIVEKISDPTLVFIIAGYADLGGDPRGNLRLSDERAQAVSNAMAENAGVINLVRTVGMGGTDLLSSRRADQNRAVEIWAVIP